MNKKQIIGLAVAGVVFASVGAISVVSNAYADLINSKKPVTQSIESMLMSNNDVSIPIEKFIGVVDVEGTIINSSQSESIFSSVQGYNHTRTLNYIDQMIDAKNNKGIILYVNSPGGGVYESDELYLKLKEYKEKTGRPIWTYMANQACSGGYYISMASDKIYANRNTWTGSIGVIMSMANLKGLYDKIGVKEIDITSGPNKAMGSSGLDLTDEQHDILQSMVDESYEQFVGIVAEGRKMDVEKVKPIADGRIYTAKQALDLKLIDKIDSYENMQKEMQKVTGEDTEIFTPSTQENVFKSLFSKAEGLKTKSDVQIISEYLEKTGNGGLMYYAKPE